MEKYILGVAPVYLQNLCVKVGNVRGRLLLHCASTDNIISHSDASMEQSARSTGTTRQDVQTKLENSFFSDNYENIRRRRYVSVI